LEKYKKFLFFWGPVIAWALVIFWFSSRPTGTVSEVNWQDFVFKKFLHVVFFGMLATLIYRASINSKVSKLNSVKFSILMTVTYGILDEFHQSFTVGRQPGVRDVVFDALGALISMYVLWTLLPKAPEKVKRFAESFQLK